MQKQPILISILLCLGISGTLQWDVVKAALQVLLP